MILPKIDDSNFSEINSEKEEDNESDVGFAIFRVTIVNLSMHTRWNKISSETQIFWAGK